MEYISGADRGQMMLLPNCVEDYVSEDNPVRVIDAFVEQINLRDMDFSKYEPNETGRPMYSPKDLLKLYLYGYMNKIRSSRNLEKETHKNLEVIWLLNGLKPDHKTIARFRQDNPGALKNVFRSFVKLCMRAGLYGNTLIAVDGSKFVASNSKERNFTKAKLEDRIKRIDAKIESYLREMNEQDAEENVDTNCEAESISEVLKRLRERKDDFQQLLKGLDETGETQVSLTDADSRIMKTKDGLFVSYNVQAAVDSKYKMAAEFFVTNQAQDKNLLFPMTVKAAEILETSSVTVVADKGYDGASDIARVVRAGHTPVVTGTAYELCIPAKSSNGEEIEGYDSENARAVYLPERNVFVCPMGKILRPCAYVKSKHEAKYKNAAACGACAQKCSNARYYVASRYIKHSEFSREYDDSPILLTKVFVAQNPEVAKQRKCMIEHVFGSLKRNLGVSYLLMRGISKVEGELSLAFLAYNMKRALNILGVKNMIQAMQM